MATTTSTTHTATEVPGTTGPTVREVNGHGADRIDKGAPLTHTTTNISLSPELFEKVPNRHNHKLKKIENDS